AVAAIAQEVGSAGDRDGFSQCLIEAADDGAAGAAVRVLWRVRRRNAGSCEVPAYVVGNPGGAGDESADAAVAEVRQSAGETRAGPGDREKVIFVSASWNEGRGQIYGR